MRESGAQIACRWGWGCDFCTSPLTHRFAGEAFLLGESARLFLLLLSPKVTPLNFAIVTITIEGDRMSITLIPTNCRHSLIDSISQIFWTNFCLLEAT